MKRTLLVLLVLFGVTALAQQGREGRGQAQGGAQGAGRAAGAGGPAAAPAPWTPPPGAVEIPYDATAGLVKLPPDVRTLGEVVGEIQNWRMQRLMLKPVARSSTGG